MAGKGQADTRIVGVAYSTEIESTIWSRREIVTQNFQLSLTAECENEAREFLNKYKGRIILTGQIAQTKGLKYGRDWNYGDRVLSTYLGYTFDCRINGYEINYSNSGDTTVDTVTAFIVGDEQV